MDDAAFEELCRMADTVENGRAEQEVAKPPSLDEEQDDGFGLLLQLASEAQDHEAPPPSPPKRHAKAIAMPPPSKASSSHSLLSNTASKATEKPITEAYAGIRVRNPVVPLPTLQDKLQSSVFFQLKDVRSAAGAVGLDGHWATLGVVCQRAQPRESDGGSVYSIAKLTDLQGTVLSLMLFGRAHESFYREPEGMVVAVFDAKPKRGGVGGGGGGFSVSISQGRQLIVVGRCPDYGTCKALRKYKAMQLKVAPQFADNNLITAYRPVVNRSNAGMMGMHSGMGNGGDGRPAPRVRRMGSQEIRDVAQRCGSGSNGARFLQSVAARLDAEAAPPPATTTNTKTTGRTPTAQHSVEELAARARAVEIMRQLGGVRGTTQTTPVPTNTTPTATATTHAAKRARQHSPPCHTAHAHHPPSTTSAPTPTNPTTSSFAAAFGPIVADASNADGSRYAGLAAGVEQARLDSVMQGLVEKDAVAEKMSSITTMQVSAWQCHTCSRISERRYPECRDHQITRITTTKRWWTCSTCKYHFSTVGSKYPAHACRKCKDTGARFVRANMYKGGPADRHAPGENLVASRDKLLVRGVEHGFSLK